MIVGRTLKKVLEKFFKSPVVQDARVQICLPNGQFFDVENIRLMENKLLGVRETHRLVITVAPEKVSMGQVIKKL